MTSTLNTISLLKLDSRNQAVVNQNKKAYKKANIFITNSEAVNISKKIFEECNLLTCFQS